MGAVSRVRVSLGERSYPVFVGQGLLDEAGARLARLGLSGRVAVVTQERPGRLYAARLLRSLEEAGFDPFTVVVPDGEEAKTPRQATRLWELFARRGMERWSTVVALGGGTVGDLAGFAAGAWMRGVPFVQVPTTLVAQVDASIGGKTAVNLSRAKNPVGLFHQPRAVLCDTGTLRSLPLRDLRAGLAEVIRSAAIADPRLFAWLERHCRDVLRRDPEALGHAVRRSAAIKAAIVAADEREERDVRALLNYGHTAGHAIEAAGGFHRWRHGEAVALGMAVAARVGTRLGLVPVEVCRRQVNLLKAAGLPVTLRGVSPRIVLNSLKMDKKIRRGKLRFVLTPRIGHARVYDGVCFGDIAGALSEGRPAAAGKACAKDHKGGQS